MTEDRVKERRIEAFLQLAQEERAAAERLVDVLPRQAIYFVQQSAEKLVRALLEQQNISAGTSHNLRFLAGLLPEGHAMKEHLLDLDDLSPVATRFRYPSVSGRLAAITAAEVRHWLARIASLEDEVNGILRKTK